LPPAVQAIARKNFALWKRDPWHPSLHFKKIKGRWSVRVGRDHRAVALVVHGTWYWYWIGPHAEYERLIDEL
jgi:hypothetical protein